MSRESPPSGVEGDGRLGVSANGEEGDPLVSCEMPLLFLGKLEFIVGIPGNNRMTRSAQEPMQRLPQVARIYKQAPWLYFHDFSRHTVIRGWVTGLTKV